MKKVSLLLLFIVALCLLNSCSLFNVPGTDENVWVADGFKLTEDDEVFLVTTENRLSGSFQAVFGAFKIAGLLESGKDPHIVESVEQIRPSGSGRVYFIEYNAVPAYVAVSKIQYSYSRTEYYSFFSINVYDYQTKNLVASNSFEKTMFGKTTVENTAIYSTTNYLLKAIVPEKNK